jgi:hypothetical protein
MVASEACMGAPTIWCKIQRILLITIYVPVVFMARFVMVLGRATSLRGALEGVSPEIWDFFGPKWQVEIKYIKYSYIYLPNYLNETTTFNTLFTWKTAFPREHKVQMRTRISRRRVIWLLPPDSKSSLFLSPVSCPSTLSTGVGGERSQIMWRQESL